MSDTLDFSKSKLDEGDLKAMQQRIRNKFAQIGSALQLFSPGTQLFECINPILAAGHTPGHCMFEISSQERSLLHLCDIAHDEALLFAKPEWGTIFDTDFEMAAQTRHKVLERLANSKQPVFGYHLPWPGFGQVTRRHGGFRWMPARVTSPQWPVMI
jgi:glyoxylase-like metal-dependent hydrolase (beta-lactamase superfamily II)